MKLSCAEGVMMGMTGRSSSVRPGMSGSGTKTALGEESNMFVVVTHGISAFVVIFVSMAEVSHPSGNAGGVTASKSSVNVVARTSLPSWKEKLNDPRLFV